VAAGLVAVTRRQTSDAAPGDGPIVSYQADPWRAVEQTSIREEIVVEG
jgi:hypothetical protein